MRTIKSDDGCWRFQGAKSSSGYGFIANGQGKSIGAHRAAWEIVYGPIPAGLEIDHLCETRDCVRVEHLSLATHRDNTLRGQTVTGLNARKTHCRHGHPLSGDNIYIHIYNGHEWRQCKTCVRAAGNRYQARHKAARSK